MHTGLAKNGWQVVALPLLRTAYALAKSYMTVNTREEQILAILCWPVRCAVLRQLATILDIPESLMKCCCQRLLRNEYVGATTISLHVPALVEPLAVWEDGELPADFHQVAWLLERRSQQRSPRRERVIWATNAATRIVGGVGGRLRQPLQVEHDLGTTEIFVNKCRVRRGDHTWLGEDAYRAFVVDDRREKRPDAVELDAGGQVMRVYEFGGQYSWRRLLAFHRFWSARRIAYEIW